MTQAPVKDKTYYYNLTVQVPCPCSIQVIEEELNREMTEEELMDYIKDNPESISYDLDASTGAEFKDWLIYHLTSDGQDVDLEVEED